MGDTASKETPVDGQEEQTFFVRFRGFLIRVAKRAGGVVLLIVGFPAFISGLILFLLGLVLGDGGAYLSKRGADLLGVDSSYFSEGWLETREAVSAVA